MANLSNDQLTAIAQEFHDISAAVGQIRLNHIHDGAALDDPQVVQLLGLQWSLLNTSSSFYVQAARVTLADADQAAATISAATSSANAALKKIATIDKVINIASNAGVLAAAIMTGDMNQIGSAAQGLINLVNA
jgi:hypothetical protein